MHMPYPLHSFSTFILAYLWSNYIYICRTYLNIFLHCSNIEWKTRCHSTTWSTPNQFGIKGSGLTTSPELWAKAHVVGEVKAHSKWKLLVYFDHLILKAYYEGFWRGLWLNILKFLISFMYCWVISCIKSWAVKMYTNRCTFYFLCTLKLFPSCDADVVILNGWLQSIWEGRSLKSFVCFFWWTQSSCWPPAHFSAYMGKHSYV